MLFAARDTFLGVYVFAYQAGFSHVPTTPSKPWHPLGSGDGGNRTPVRNSGNTTYSSYEESHMSDLNRRPHGLQNRCSIQLS